ncbi:Hypothetical predicted protein [Marmota monax]|uniref:Uncharacterized protein n=1 Tax=Marmota monax TaxID=9995 RepID=A0A5E4D7I7_MARMO|nr:hypothetical protein GHT09_012801 [Marmota monax]VTJ90125.1 Hypothetical predicted protein [Marmota monax]
MVCLNAPQQVCEPADAFWKLAVPSKSQWWVGVAVELLGNITLERATFISITTLALHRFRAPGLCMSEEKIFRRRVHAVKKIFRTNPGFQSQVQPDLHDSAAAPSSFSCISRTKLQLPACSCASLSDLPLTSCVKCI